MNEKLIAVGFEYDVPIEQIIAKLNKIMPSFDSSKYLFLHHVQSGVWYNQYRFSKEDQNVSSQDRKP